MFLLRAHYILLTLIFLTYGFVVNAQTYHERVRRITVFPLKVDAEMSSLAETIWWDLREQLTTSKRFMVASKNFMQAKDVFQPRAALQPADALILGRLLDANALITTYQVDKKISMRVYEAKSGATLWAGDYEMHPAVLPSKQLASAVNKLLLDFLASVPYQGFVVVDNLVGKPWYTQGERQFFKADIGSGTQVTVGDSVQLVRVKAEKYKPLFQDGAVIEVYLEGKVAQVDRNIVSVQVTRKLEGEEVQADALVRIPDELRRLKELYGMHESSEKNLVLDSLRPVREELTQNEKEKKPLVAALSWIGNLALLLLIAF